MKKTFLAFLRTFLVAAIMVAICILTNGTLNGTPAFAKDTATNQTITSSEMIARAQSWVYAGYTYNTDASKPDVLGTNYRTDCSGLVSMAWHLDQSYDTQEFNVDKSGMWHTISIDSLAQGDAYVRHDSTEQHMELFDKWDDSSDHSKGFEVYSFNEPGYTVENPIQENNTGHLGHRSYGSLDGFHAIRFDKKIDDQSANTTSSLASGAQCSATTTYNLPDSTVNLKEKTCYALTHTVDGSDPTNSPVVTLFNAYEEISWTGGGSGKLDGLTAHVDIQKNDQTTTEGYCSGLEDLVNASASGTTGCQLITSSLPSGSWTADGWLHYDINNDGKIWNMIYVAGSPSASL